MPLKNKKNPLIIFEVLELLLEKMMIDMQYDQVYSFLLEKNSSRNYLLILHITMLIIQDRLFRLHNKFANMKNSMNIIQRS